jgi:hypothetical protein
VKSPQISIARINCIVAAAIMFHALIWGGHASAAGHSGWATGPELQRRLAQPVDILWSNNPLRGAMASLSRVRQVAILMDRRVDPGQRVDLRVQDVPMESALRTIAERCGLGISRLGSVVYLGPPTAAERLPAVAAALAQSVRRLPITAQRRFFQVQPFCWKDLSTPRDLLAQLGRQNGIEISGLNRVPHDLWAAADLPPLSLINRLLLVAIQFDLTFEVATGGSRLALTPMPENLSPPASNRRATRAASPTPKSPTNDRVAGVGQIRIQRLSVKDEPLGPVLRQLAGRLKLELRIDQAAIAEAGISLDQRVSATIEDATVDDLFRQLLKSTGLRFQRRQRVVEILPAR